jgi:DNA-binding CsgD family transcriptional regulator
MPGYPTTGTPLSPRERAVLQGLAEGKGYSDIVAPLACSERTARNHAWHAAKRLGARTIAHAVAEAMRSGEVT